MLGLGVNNHNFLYKDRIIESILFIDYVWRISYIMGRGFIYFISSSLYPEWNDFVTVW